MLESTKMAGIATVITAAAAAVTFVPAAGQDVPGPGDLRLASCEREGVAPPARCGTFTVWENRDERRGRTLDLSVVILEATGPDRRPDPIVFLVGGPGQAATSMARGMSGHEIREHRDIVLVDQRGTGDSNGLYCGPDPTSPLQAFMATMDAERARTCREELAGRADLRFYLTSYAMDDLDDLRTALGYDRINLQGGSYGTRAALEYIRRHGEHVRSAILTGSTAFSHPMPSRFARDAEAALANVIRECAAEVACAEAFPALEDDYRRAIGGLDGAGVTLEVSDPRSGDPVEVRFGARDLAESLRAMLYSPRLTRHIPLLLHHAATTGDYRPFAELQIRRNLGLTRGIAEGMYFAVTCTEDVARVDPERVYASGRGTFLSDHRARPHIEGCEGWPLGRLPDDFGEEVESDVPVLIVTGANDPATPPASAHAAASRLSAARVVIVPQAGHSLDGLEGSECLWELVRRFLQTADARTLDPACVADVRRQPFVLGMEPEGG